jgi:hypothetical protein
MPEISAGHLRQILWLVTIQGLSAVCPFAGTQRFMLFSQLYA